MQIDIKDPKIIQDSKTNFNNFLFGTRQKNLIELDPILVQNKIEKGSNINNLSSNAYIPNMTGDVGGGNLQLESLNFLLKYIKYNQDQLFVVANFQSNSLQDLDKLATVSKDALKKLIDDINAEIKQKIAEAEKAARTGGILGFLFSIISIIIAVIEVVIACATGNLAVGLVGIFSLTDSVCKAIGNLDIAINPEDALDENNIFFEMSSNGMFGAMGHEIGGKNGKSFAAISENLFNMLTTLVNITNDVNAGVKVFLSKKLAGQSVTEILKELWKDILILFTKLTDAVLRMGAIIFQIKTTNDGDTKEANYYAMLTMGIIGAIIVAIQKILDSSGVDQKTSGLLLNGIMLLAGLLMLYKNAHEDPSTQKTILSAITAVIASIIVALPLILEKFGIDDYDISQNIISMLAASITTMLLHSKLNEAHSEEILVQLSQIYEADNLAPVSSNNMFNSIFEKVKMSFNERLNLKTQVNQANAGVLNLITTLYNSYVQQSQSLSVKEGNQIETLNDKNDSSRELLNKMFTVFTNSIEDYVNQIKYATRI
jgi:hypothetical protein